MMLGIRCPYSCTGEDVGSNLLLTISTWDSGRIAQHIVVLLCRVGRTSITTYAWQVDVVLHMMCMVKTFLIYHVDSCMDSSTVTIMLISM
jgi:hypothetical protein